MSGLSRTPGKRVWDNIPPRVRIPPSPPEQTIKPLKTVAFLFMQYFQLSKQLSISSSVGLLPSDVQHLAKKQNNAYEGRLSNG